MNYSYALKFWYGTWKYGLIVYFPVSSVDDQNVCSSSSCKNRKTNYVPILAPTMSALVLFIALLVIWKLGRRRKSGNLTSFIIMIMCVVCSQHTRISTKYFNRKSCSSRGAKSEKWCKMTCRRNKKREGEKKRITNVNWQCLAKIF